MLARAPPLTFLLAGISLLESPASRNILPGYSCWLEYGPLDIPAGGKNHPLVSMQGRNTPPEYSCMAGSSPLGDLTKQELSSNTPPWIVPTPTQPLTKKPAPNQHLSLSSPTPSCHPSYHDENEAREIRTPNLLIWSQTRCRCAIAPCFEMHRLPTTACKRETQDTLFF